MILETRYHCAKPRMSPWQGFFTSIPKQSQWPQKTLDLALHPHTRGQ